MVTRSSGSRLAITPGAGAAAGRPESDSVAQAPRRSRIAAYSVPRWSSTYHSRQRPVGYANAADRLRLSNDERLDSARSRECVEGR